MIYRKWSLLTGPTSIVGAVVGTVIVAHFLFAQNDPSLKVKPKNSETLASSK